MPFISCLHHVYAVYTMFIPGFMRCLYYIYTSWFYHDYTMIIPCSYSVYTMNIPCLYRVCTMLIPCLHHDDQHVYSIPCLCHAYTKFKQWLYYVYTDTWYMFIVLSCFYDVFIPCLYPLLPNGRAISPLRWWAIVISSPSDAGGNDMLQGRIQLRLPCVVDLPLCPDVPSPMPWGMKMDEMRPENPGDSWMMWLGFIGFADFPYCG